MITSREQFFSEVLDLGREKIPLARIAYFRERFRNRLHQLVLRRFLALEDLYGFSRADLAQRIGRDAAQVTRWLGAPGNWTLDTVSDLLAGMGAELDSEVADLKTKLTQPVCLPFASRGQPTPREPMAARMPPPPSDAGILRLRSTN